MAQTNKNKSFILLRNSSLNINVKNGHKTKSNKKLVNIKSNNNNNKNDDNKIKLKKAPNIPSSPKNGASEGLMTHIGLKILDMEMNLFKTIEDEFKSSQIYNNASINDIKMKKFNLNNNTQYSSLLKRKSIKKVKELCIEGKESLGIHIGIQPYGCNKKHCWCFNYDEQCRPIKVYYLYIIIYY